MSKIALSLTEDEWQHVITACDYAVTMIEAIKLRTGAPEVRSALDEQLVRYRTLRERIRTESERSHGGH